MLSQKCLWKKGRLLHYSLFSCSYLGEGESGLPPEGDRGGRGGVQHWLLHLSTPTGKDEYLMDSSPNARRSIYWTPRLRRGESDTDNSLLAYPQARMNIYFLKGAHIRKGESKTRTFLRTPHRWRLDSPTKVERCCCGWTPSEGDRGGRGVV